MSDLQVRGPLWGGSGTPSPFTAGYSGGSRIQDAHSRFTDACLGGRLFSWGKTSTVLNATSTSSVLDATITPVIGVWNPTTSGVNLVLLQATVIVAQVPASAGITGAFMYSQSTGSAAITTGNTPWNRKTMVQSGSLAKGFDLATALTGKSNANVVSGAAAVSAMTGAQGATVTPLIGGVFTDNIDGSRIVPPGGVICIQNTTANTTVLVAAELLWEEIPIFV